MVKGLKNYLRYEVMVFKRAVSGTYKWFKKHPIVSLEFVAGCIGVAYFSSIQALEAQVTQFLAAAVFIVASAFLLNTLSASYNLFSDVERKLEALSRGKDNTAILRDRQQWKKEFEAHLLPVNEYGSRGDAIIRDVARMDSYPKMETSNQKSLSLWFKVEIKGLYHRGLEVFVGVDTVKQDQGTRKWRFAKYDEPDAVTVYVVGRIPFDGLRSVEWDGDEFKAIPHFYCDFSKYNGQPYEEYVFVRSVGTAPYQTYVEIGNRQDILRSN